MIRTVLMANKYFYLKGGAENSFFETAGLLERKGHRVIHFSMQHPKNLPSAQSKYFVSEVDYDKKGWLNKWDVSMKLLYSFEARRQMERLLSDERPDIAHLNSIYHQISPSVLHPLKKHGIPVVMTLRDLKVVCASYLMFAKGQPCDACKGGRYYQCFLKSCVKDSRTKSLLNTAEMYLHHRMLRLYDLVDIFISPSEFLKNKVSEMGFKGRVIHLPNFTTLTELEPRYDWDQPPTIVYYGRVSKEKGLSTLVRALSGTSLRLKVIGDGPLLEQLTQSLTPELKERVSFLGHLTGKSLQDEVRRSMFVVLASEVYENNPRTIIEGFAMGKPAVGSRMGGIPELIKEGVTGYTFKAGDSDDLRAQLLRLSSDPEKIRAMGRSGRVFIEERLGFEAHYRKLMEVYEEAIRAREARA